MWSRWCFYFCIVSLFSHYFVCLIFISNEVKLFFCLAYSTFETPVVDKHVPGTAPNTLASLLEHVLSEKLNTLTMPLITWRLIVFILEMMTKCLMNYRDYEGCFSEMNIDDVHLKNIGNVPDWLKTLLHQCFVFFLESFAIIRGWVI